MAQMAFAEHHDMIEAIPCGSSRSAVGVLPGSTRGRRAVPNTDGSNPTYEYLAVGAIAVPDQVTRDLLPATRLRQLIGDPLGRATHNGLATFISRISRRISKDTGGRPQRRRDFHRQYDLKPAQCQRITLSGRTISSASYILGNSRQTPLNISLSIDLNETPSRLARRSTLTCCLSTKISASSVARDRSRSITAQKISLPTSSGSIARFPINRQRIGFATETPRYGTSSRYLQNNRRTSRRSDFREHATGASFRFVLPRDLPTNVAPIHIV
jgi:hypothetical protein